MRDSAVHRSRAGGWGSGRREVRHLFFEATLFELAAGRAPFTEGDLFYHHIHTPVPPLRSVAPDVPEAPEALVAHCLAKSPAERFQSAGEMLSYAQASGLV